MKTVYPTQTEQFACGGGGGCGYNNTVFITLSTGTYIKSQYDKCPKLNFFMQLFLKLLSEMANSVDPDQTAPSGAAWSGSALFAYAILYCQKW